MFTETMKKLRPADASRGKCFSTALAASLMLAVPTAQATDLIQESPGSLFNLSIEQLTNITLVTAASGFEQNIKNAPATVTVIHKEEWQAMGARTLGEVIETVPGMHVVKPQVYNSNEQYTTRGINGDFGQHIKLLIDGESFEFMLNGGMFVGFHMPLSLFKRIEVIKGPGSAIYGADAFAGVINLVTEKADRENTAFGARMGDFASRDGFGLHTSTSENASWMFGFEFMESDDDKNRIVSSDMQSMLDEELGTNASKAPGPLDDHYQVLTLLARWRTDFVQLNYWSWRNFDAGTGAGLAQALDPTGESEALFEQYSAQFFLDGWRESDDLTLTLGYKRQETNTSYTIFPAGTKLLVGRDGYAKLHNYQEEVSNGALLTLFPEGYTDAPSSTGYTGFAKLTHLFGIASNHIIRWELGYEKNNFNAREHRNFGPGILAGAESSVDGTLEKVTDPQHLYVPSKTRNFKYLSLQDEWQITRDIQLTLGIRHDNYSDFGSTTNTRMGFIWNKTDQTRFRLFSGTAFRAPSYADLYLQNNPIAAGNPDLEPEKIFTLETGVSTELLSPDLSLSFNLFYYKAQDLIAYTTSDVGNATSTRENYNPLENYMMRGRSPIEINASSRATNSGDYEGKGIELVAHWKPTQSLAINANYSYLHGENEAGEVMADIPLRQAFAALNWRIDANWNWNIRTKWIADRKRAVGSAHYIERESTDDYLWWTTKVAYTDLIPGLEVGLIVDNLFDEDAREPSNGLIADDYPLAGRQWVLETRYEF